MVEAGLLDAYRHDLRVITAQPTPQTPEERGKQEAEYVAVTEEFFDGLMSWYQFKTATATSAEALDADLEDYLADFWGVVHEERAVESGWWSLFCSFYEENQCPEDDLSAAIYQNLVRGEDNDPFADALALTFRQSYAADIMVFRAAVSAARGRVLMSPARAGALLGGRAPRRCRRHARPRVSVPRVRPGPDRYRIAGGPDGAVIVLGSHRIARRRRRARRSNDPSPGGGAPRRLVPGVFSRRARCPRRSATRSGPPCTFPGPRPRSRW